MDGDIEKELKDKLAWFYNEGFDDQPVEVPIPKDVFEKIPSDELRKTASYYHAKVVPKNDW